MLINSIKFSNPHITITKRKKHLHNLNQIQVQTRNHTKGFGARKGEVEGRSLVRRNPKIRQENDKSVQYAKITETLNEILNEDKQSASPIIKCVKPGFISRFSKEISNNPNQNILIGISGESASGKSTICKTIDSLSQKLNMPIELISADNYFNDISALIAKYGSFDKLLETGYDVDSPNNFYMDRLHDDLEQLANGQDVKIPQYLVNGTGISVPNAISKEAKKIIVVEGMATMYSPVRELLNAQIYVDVEPEVQEKRYIARAKKERNQTEEDALKQLDYVRDAAKKYILPKKENADIIIDGCVDKENYINFLSEIFSKTY